MATPMKVSNTPITLKQLLPLATITLNSGLVPFVTSQPGVGKSSLAKQYAKDNNLKFIDIRLAGYDPTLIDGFPMVDKESGRAFFAHQSTWPLETDELPLNEDLFKQNLEEAFENNLFTKDDFDNKTEAFLKVEEDCKAKSYYSGWFILLDELTSAPQSVQAAAYRLILDREVGDKALHPKVKMMAAGNRIIDNAIAGKLGSALQSRVVHYEVLPDHKAFKEWALNAGLNPRVVAFTELFPETVTNFDPAHKDVTFCCSRTLEFLAKQVDSIQQSGGALDSYDYMPLYAGTVGHGIASKFRTFMAVFGNIPSLKDILANPAGIPIPSEPDKQHAIAAMVGENLDTSNAPILMQFLNRTHPESQVTSLKTAIKRQPALSQVPEVKNWIVTTASKLRSI